MTIEQKGDFDIEYLGTENMLLIDCHYNRKKNMGENLYSIQ